MYLKICIFFFCIFGITAHFYTTNVTDYNNCQIYYSRFETNYSQFFELDASEDRELFVDFHFAVLAQSDAHILMGTTSQVKANDPAYEIVLGAGGNTFSDIRRKQKGNVRTSHREKGVLSAVDITGFWIHIYKNGLINVGKEGSLLGFMNWTDTELLPVKYFAFSGWSVVELKWFFDCPRPAENTTQVTRPQTEVDRLRNYILNLNESHNDIVKVNVQLTSQFVSLNEKASILNLKGRANFSWKFTPITWNPENYSNITSVILEINEIWKPDVIITNAIDSNHFQPFNGKHLIANYNGDIHWRPVFDIFTYCSLDGIENWPNDVHECDIYMETWFSQHNYIEFDVTAPSESIHLNTNNYDSEWYIEEGPNIHIYKITNLHNSPDMYVKQSNSLKLRITIRRRTSLYNTAFNTPLLVIATMMLLNFWTSPFDKIKICLVAGQFLLTIMSMIGLAVVLPGHRDKIPIIVYRYSALITAIILNLIISVIVINLARNKRLYEPTHTIGRIIKSKIVEKVLFLPELTPIISSPYPTSTQAIRRRSRVQDVWIRLSMCIDRLSFAIFLGLLLSLLYAK